MYLNFFCLCSVCLFVVLIFVMMVVVVYVVDWIVFGNDGKYQCVEGCDIYLFVLFVDMLMLFDVSIFLLKVVLQVDVENGIQGLLQVVVIMFDVKFVFVGVLMCYDMVVKQFVFDMFL